MDVNSKEAELWSETMRLKSENEHLRDLLSPCVGWLEYAYNNVSSVTADKVKEHLTFIRKALDTV